MSKPATGHGEFAALSREEMHSALFVQMIMQQSNMAMMLLGRVPDPQSGQTLRDLEAAKLFIDQLEALEAKTKGNLTKDEDVLLKQTLMALRLAFVEAVESPKPAVNADLSPPQSPTSAPEDKAAPAQRADAATEESSVKRFSKKYSS